MNLCTKGINGSSEYKPQYRLLSFCESNTKTHIRYYVYVYIMIDLLNVDS